MKLIEIMTTGLQLLDLAMEDSCCTWGWVPAAVVISRMYHYFPPRFKVGNWSCKVDAGSQVASSIGRWCHLMRFSSTNLDPHFTHLVSRPDSSGRMRVPSSVVGGKVSEAEVTSPIVF